MKAFYIRCRYLDNRVVIVLLFCLEEQLEHKLRLPYTTKAYDGDLYGIVTGK